MFKLMVIAIFILLNASMVLHFTEGDILEPTTEL